MLSFHLVIRRPLERVRMGVTNRVPIASFSWGILLTLPNHCSWGLSIKRNGSVFTEITNFTAVHFSLLSLVLGTVLLRLWAKAYYPRWGSAQEKKNETESLPVFETLFLWPCTKRWIFCNTAFALPTHVSISLFRLPFHHLWIKPQGAWTSIICIPTWSPAAANQSKACRKSGPDDASSTANCPQRTNSWFCSFHMWHPRRLGCDSSIRTLWRQRRIFIIGGLGYFKLGALLEGMSRVIWKLIQAFCSTHYT